MARSVVFFSFGPPKTFASAGPLVFPCPMVHREIFSDADPVRHTYEFVLDNPTRELKEGEEFEISGGDCKCCPFYDSSVLGLCSPLNKICHEQNKDWSLMRLLLATAEKHWLYLHLTLPYGALTDFQKDRARPVYVDPKYSGFFSRLMVVIKYMLSHDTELPGDLDSCMARFREQSANFAPVWKAWAKGFLDLYDRMRPVMARQWS